MFSKHDREILLTIAKMDLKVRYQNSKIGIAWSLLRPIMQFFAYFVVFGVILKVSDSKDYSVRLFLGIVLWNLFLESTGNALTCYIGKKSIITKIHVRKELLPISSYLTAIFSFFITMIVFVLTYTLYCVLGITEPNLENIWRVPVFLATYSVFIISVNIILANANALFRDVQTVWDLVLSYLVFMSPIMYSLNIPDKYLNVYYFSNPIAYPIEAIRSAFFSSSCDWKRVDHLVTYLSSIVFWLVAAIVINKKLKSRVSDYL